VSSGVEHNMNSIKDLTPQQLRQAADLQEQIIALGNELDQLLGSSPQANLKVTTGKRRLSAQGLANIRAGARRRWARSRNENGALKQPSGRKRKMSAAGRASIAARMKARWAAAKRAGRNAL
jgi:hypothetical protein